MNIDDLIQESISEIFQEYHREPNLIMLGTKVYRALTDRVISSYPINESIIETYNGIEILVILGLKNANKIICGLNKIKVYEE